MTALVLLLAVLTGQPDSIDEPAQWRGDVEARLHVVVPEEGPGPGLARLRVTLTFIGPEGLDVQGPRLEDALAAWRVVRQASSWRRQEDRVHWCLTLQIDQVKPGQVPTPSVVAAVRTSPDRPWQEVAWNDLLNEARDVAPPAMLPPLPVSPWPDRLRWLCLALVCALLLLGLARAVRRRLVVRRPPSAHARALARLEPSALPSPDRPRERFAHAEAVVRDYLDEQRGLKTRQQTTAEVLAVSGELPVEARLALRELLERGELVKFAGLAPSPLECDQAIELARHVVRACAAARSMGEAAGETEPRKAGWVG